MTKTSRWVVLFMCLLPLTSADARYYDPKTGTFLQEDSEDTAAIILRRQRASPQRSGFQVDESVPSVSSQRLNPYPYVENNPVNRVDPFGLFPAEGLLRQPWLSPVTPPGLTPFDSADATVCSVATQAQAASEVQCQLVDQSETVCQYKCSDGSFKVLDRRRVGGVCPPVIVYRYP